MTIVWNLTCGALWVASTTTRLGFNAVVLSASTVITVVKVFKAVEQVVEALFIVEKMSRGMRGTSTTPLSSPRSKKYS